MKRNKYLIIFGIMWVAVVAALFVRGSLDEKSPKYADEKSIVGVVPSDEINVSSSAIKTTDTADDHIRSNTENITTHKGKNKEKSVSSKQVNKEDKNNIDDSKDDKKPSDKSKQNTKQKLKKNQKKSKTTDKPKNKKNASKDSDKSTKDNKKDTYTFTIQCLNIMDDKSVWREGLDEFIPSNGIYYKGKRKYKDGMSVYDALKEICAECDILLDSRYTPLYGTYYVSGIGNLYEFDCGAQSGWKYSVNAKLPGIGCSRYMISKGDEVVFFYDTKI